MSQQTYRGYQITRRAPREWLAACTFKMSFCWTQCLAMSILKLVQN